MRSVWGRWPMVVFCWFVGAVLVVLWLLSVSVAAAGAAQADSESYPGNLSAVLDDDVAVVSWTAPAGGAVTYQVYRREAVKDDEYQQIGITGSTVYRDRVSRLTPGIEYYYRVKTVDRKGRVGGWGPASNYASLTTPAPVVVSAVLRGDLNGVWVVVTWTAPLGHPPRFGESPAGFLLLRRTAVKGTKYKEVHHSPTNDSSVTHSHASIASDLTPGDEYFYRVKYVDRKGRVGGWGSGSNYASLRMPAPVVVSAVVDDGSVRVTWKRPYGDARKYFVYRRAAVKGSEYEQIARAGGPVYRDPVSGLTPGVEYYYRVKAINKYGRAGLSWGSGSNYAAAIYTPPPSGLSAVLDGGSVVVSWTAPLGHPARYLLYRRAAVEGDEYQQIGKTSGSTVFRDPVSGLSPGVEYYYRVKAVDRRGTSGSWGTGSNYADVKIP